MSARHTGLVEVASHEQITKYAHPNVGAQPLPAGVGGRAGAVDVGITEPLAGGITFHVIGDSGGVKDPSPQHAVRHAMSAVGADFVYHVGDVVYFNGDSSEYVPQFYEPYATLRAPIVGIPGNHDGDTTDDPSRQPLDTFMANFCSKTPSFPAVDPDGEYGRDTQTQPYCYWTLALRDVTIIGLYSNVPSGGWLDGTQIQWLIGELQAAPTNRPLIVALHHPPFSVDAHHGGSAHMADVLDGAFQAARRAPNLVLSGHVHNYQRFTRDGTDQPWQKSITYVVMGNSGYHNLHALAPDATPGSQPTAGVMFQAGDDKHYGFLSVVVHNRLIFGSYVRVTPGVMSDGSDATLAIADQWTIDATV